MEDYNADGSLQEAETEAPEASAAPAGERIEGSLATILETNEGIKYIGGKQNVL